ncbi:hypothetical protein ACFV6F_08960 [Kitasatospora phosalacinea]|uniref:hypothetical protein n=1 Tax=Kitasatospora phosalacinea TaxID=2065 RepID=UPI00365FDD76
MSEQHRADGDRDASYLVFYNTAHMHDDVPGLPAMVAVRVQRDHATGTFEMEYARHPLVAMGEAWLVQRGADPAAFARQGPIAPADRETERVEALLRGSGTRRFEIHDDYSFDTAPYDTWVIATDTLAADPARPVRVFHDRRQIDADTYTLREGHFASVEDARAWTDDLDSPLPPAVLSPSARAAAALLGTSSAAAGWARVISTPPPAAPPPGNGRPPSR